MDSKFTVFDLTNSSLFRRNAYLKEWGIEATEDQSFRSSFMEKKDHIPLENTKQERTVQTREIRLAKETV